MGLNIFAWVINALCVIVAICAAAVGSLAMSVIFGVSLRVGLAMSGIFIFCVLTAAIKYIRSCEGKPSLFARLESYIVDWHFAALELRVQEAWAAVDFFVDIEDEERVVAWTFRAHNAQKRRDEYVQSHQGQHRLAR